MQTIEDTYTKNRKVFDLEYSVANTFCKKCGLYKNVKNPCIIGRGNPKADLLFIGEAPGYNEDDQGIPFIGKSGKLLQYFLDKYNIDCYITNAVRCRPSHNNKNRAPNFIEIEMCRTFTIDIILRMKPKVVCALGKVAFNSLIKTKASMEAVHGQTFYHPELNIHIIPLYHPSALLQNNDHKFRIDFEKDILKVLDFLKDTPIKIIQTQPMNIEDPVDIRNYLKTLLKSDAVVIDLETISDTNIHDGVITDISFCNKVGKGVHIKWDKMLEHFDLLQEILEACDVIKVFHNADFDIRYLRKHGFKKIYPVFDTMLAQHTLTMCFENNTAAMTYGLKYMSWLLTSIGGYDSILDAFGGVVGYLKGRKKQEDNIEYPFNQLSLYPIDYLYQVLNIDKELENSLLRSFRYIKNIKENFIKSLDMTPLEFYSAMDADATYRIYFKLKYQIDKQYPYIFYNIVLPVCICLIEIHENGIKIDIDRINKLIEDNRNKAEAIKQKLYKKIGVEFNLNSTVQLKKIIFENLKIPVNKQFKTPKGEPSMDEVALKEYAKRYPILSLILDYRGIIKETSTYLEGYKKLVDEKHRVYPQYFQIGTATGRLSARNPNLQNLPRDNRIRGIIIPENNHKLVICDLSQIELRVLAMLSDDFNMIEAFNANYDFHTYTACAIFDIKMDDFDKKNPKHAEKRSNAKTINFGIVYQQSAESLAKRLDISLKKAQTFINQFFKAFPQMAQWIKDIKAFAIEHGFVENFYGRRRYLPNVYKSNIFEKEAALRQAVNTPIQSTASDIYFLGLIQISKWLKASNKTTKIVGSVHDSVILEVPYEELDEVVDKIPELMTQNIPKVKITLKADIDVLDRWEK